jgi:uncharacterized protein YuzE
MLWVMRVSYDEESDLAYVTLVDLPEGMRTAGHSVAIESEDERGKIVLDFNLDGHLVGVEVFNARHQLPPEAFDHVSSK